MENLGALKIFVRVADTLSFVEAGRQLGYLAVTTFVPKGISLSKKSIAVTIGTRKPVQTCCRVEGHMRIFATMFIQVEA